jgi:hypothetical protein
VKNKDLLWQIEVLKKTAKLFKKVNKKACQGLKFRKPPPKVISHQGKSNEPDELNLADCNRAASKNNSSPPRSNVQKGGEILQVNTANLRFMMPVLTRRNIVDEDDDDVSVVSINSDNPYGNLVVVIDAPNVAMAAGGNSDHFKVGGIEKAISYYKNLGAKVVAIIPEFYLSYSEKQKTEYKKKTNPSHPKARGMLIADNIRKLRKLKNEGVLFTTPKGDYDDSYCIEYARKHRGVIVSNDRYRDAIHRIWRCEKCDTMNRNGEVVCKKLYCKTVCAVPNRSTTRWKYKLAQWLRTHIIRFMFVNNDFTPNPDFVLP